MRSIKLPSWIERLAGLTPQPAPPHVFLLEPDRLAYGRCRSPQKSGESFVLEAFEAVELPPELFAPGLLGGPARDEEALHNALRSLLARLPSPPARASLVLPDAWLRLAFAETTELPGDEASRTQMMRWLLKRVVPFRVDELRVRGVEVASLADQEQPLRLLLGFALEELLAQMERLFAAEKVRLGRVVNVSQALLAALLEGAGGGVTGLALVQDDGYTLLFAHGGEPVLHRYKASEAGLPLDARRRLVQRDLKLTRTFLEENLPQTSLDRVLLLATDEQRGAAWAEWLEESLGAPVQGLDASHLAPLGFATSARSWLDVAPVLGASRQEVA